MQDELVLIALASRGVSTGSDLSEEAVMVMDLSEPSPWHRKVSEASVSECFPQIVDSVGLNRGYRCQKTEVWKQNWPTQPHFAATARKRNEVHSIPDSIIALAGE